MKASALFLSVFASSLTVLITASSFGQSTITGQNPAPPTASVRRTATASAEANERIPATRARLSAIIETQAQTPADAQTVVRQRSQTLLAYLQRAGVDDLQAGTMSLSPVYGAAKSSAERQPTSPEIVGYRAQWRANFEIAAERAGEIVDALAQHGAARIEGFEFTATEREIADARQRALAQAALNAREEARSVVQTLGYRAGDVVRIEIDHGGSPRPLYRAMEMAAFSAANSNAPTAVSPGFIEVRATVRLELEY